MRRSFFYNSWTLLLLFFGLFFSSCFEILEEVTIHEDGSGQAVITLNMSQSKTKLASIMLLDSINGYKVPSKWDIQSHIVNLADNISRVQGVSNVRKVMNFDDYIFSLSCDFANTNALNSVLASISSTKEAAIIAKHKQFAYNKKSHIFNRNYHYNIAKEFKRIKANDRQILKGASVTAIYRFDRPVVSIKNKAAKISKNKKAVFLKVSAQDLIKGRKNIKNQIQLGK